MQSCIPWLLAFVTTFVLSVPVAAQPDAETNSSIKIPMHNPTQQLGPLILFESQPMVKVQVSCNGQHEKLFFLVDTGCTSTMIDIKAATKLGLIAGAEAYTGIGAYSQFITHKADLPSLKLGPIEEHHLPVQIMDLGKADFIGEIDGILGANFWKKYLLTINYKKNEIELSTSYEPKSKKRTWIIPADNNQGRLYVNGTINNLYKVRMLIDTCSPHTTMPYNQAKEIFTDQIEKKRFRNFDWDINGGKARTITVHTQSFQMDDFYCTGLTIDIVKSDGQGSDDCIIGSDFLQNFRVSFDFPNQRIILEK